MDEALDRQIMQKPEELTREPVDGQQQVYDTEKLINLAESNLCQILRITRSIKADLKRAYPVLDLYQLKKLCEMLDDMETELKNQNSSMVASIRELYPKSN